MCSHVGTRLTRMKSHAFSKHGIREGTKSMDTYCVKCVNLSKKGWRSTTDRRVNAYLGQYAGSKSHQSVAKKLLSGHLIKITPEYDRGNRSLEKTMPNPQRGRAMTALCLKASRLTAAFGSSNLCALSRAYVKAMGSLSTASRNHIMASAKMIHRVVEFGMTVLVTFSESECIMSMKSARAFVDEANVVLRPNSVRNHCAAVISALGIVTIDPSLEAMFRPYSRVEINRAAEDWKRLKSCSDKTSRQEQKLKVMQGNLPNLPLLEICRIFQDLTLTVIPVALKEIRENLPECSKEVPAKLRIYWRDVTTFIATLFLLHGQRLCVVLECKIQEVQSATFSQGFAIIRVRQHKTAKAGPAAVAIRMQHYQILRDFAAIRESMSTGKPQLLISPLGGAASHILSGLQDVLSTRCPSSPEVSHKSMRKVIETNGYLLGQRATQAAAEQSDVNRYLCHGRDVTNLHYKYRTDAYVISASQSVETILTQILATEYFKKTLKVYAFEGIPGNEKTLLFFF